MTFRLLTENPTVAIIADMQLDYTGLTAMGRWLTTNRPGALEKDVTDEFEPADIIDLLLPHKGLRDPARSDDFLTDSEMLVEIAGRKCYDSFGTKAGQRTNEGYIANTQSGTIPHASIMYHAKMTFFIADISRRVTHELIRHYVGADRDEEGSPSQESTRYTHHYGAFVVPPYVLDHPHRESELVLFKDQMTSCYDAYTDYIERMVEDYEGLHGEPPRGLERKRIYESASAHLPHTAATSLIWTTNPIALKKLFKERSDSSTDLEFQRLVSVWRPLCQERWPNFGF